MKKDIVVGKKREKNFLMYMANSGVRLQDSHCIDHWHSFSNREMHSSMFGFQAFSCPLATLVIKSLDSTRYLL